MNPHTPSYSELVRQYQNTAEGNDAVFERLTTALQHDALLLNHRRYVQKHELGFGDDAFHLLWKALILEAHAQFGALEMMEIGVFKGQVISLMQLLTRQHHIPAQIHAVSPLEGQPEVSRHWLHKALYHLWPPYRERIINGDFYGMEDYPSIISKLFQSFDLDFSTIQMHRGYSTDPNILKSVQGLQLHLLYVDGDHTYQGACADIRNYVPLVVPGGWVVMDDAGADLPGTAFWKGHPSVSRACRLLPDMGFTNVLNVGHNRVFQRNIS
jgi:hypothetical protein